MGEQRQQRLPNGADDSVSSEEQPRVESEHDEEVLAAISTVEQGERERRGMPIYAVIPEEVVRSSPEEFTSFLESIFSEDKLLEDALDEILSPDVARGTAHQQVVRAVVPNRVLRSLGFNPADLLDELFDAFYEIDETLQSLQEIGEPTSATVWEAAQAVVPDAVIADPEALVSAIDRADDSRVKLNLLLQQARRVLSRLEIYRISKRKPQELIEQIREAGDLGCLQYLVDFLRSIHLAADSFESLELPRYHIRDYLKHLYMMEDWQAMADLVQRLERAVRRYTAVASKVSG